MSKALLIILSSIGISGCAKTFKLGAKDLEWNPYSGNEILIFQNNKGDTDTIFVLNIEKTKVVNDNLSPISNSHEVLSVVARHTLPSTLNSSKSESSFLRFDASKDKNTIIDFRLLAKSAVFYAESYYINDLRKIPEISLTINSSVYSDVIELRPQSNEYYEREDFITAVYWSKSKGYIRYDLKNGISWTLK